MLLVIKTLLSYHWRNWGQSLFLLAGLIAGLSLWVAVQVINETSKLSYQEASKLLDYQVTHIITSNSSQGVPLEDYVRLRRAGFDNIAPVLERRLRDDQGRLLEVLATDLFAIGNNTSNPKLVDSNDVTSENFERSFSGEAWLGFIQPPYQTYVTSELASRYSIAEGDQLVTREGVLLPPSRITSDGPANSKLVMDIGAAMSVFDQEGFDYIAVTSVDQKRLNILLETIGSPAFRNLQIVGNTQALNLTQLTNSFHINLTAMSLLSLAVGLFIIYNAAQFSVLYRRASIKTMRACGVSLAELSLGLLYEYLVWVAIGTGISCGLGYWLGNSLLPSVSATLNSLYGASVAPGVAFNMNWLWQTFLIALLGMGLAIVIPMWNLLFTVSITKPFLNQNKISSQKEWVSVVAIAILLIFAWLLLSGELLENKDELVGAFAGLAALLVVGMLVLSKLIVWLLRLGKTVIPHSWHKVRWVLSDIWLQLPRTKIAFMAILLALVANIGVNVMVNSFRSAFNEWIDYRLAADIYVAGDRGALTANDLEGVLAISESSQHSVNWEGQNISLRGVDSYDPTYSDLTAFSGLVAESDSSMSLELIKQQWFAGSGIFINEQMRYKQDLRPGDLFTLDTSIGVKTYEVLATLHDYGNTEFQVYLPLSELQRNWPDLETTGWSLMLNNSQDEGAIIDQLEAGGIPLERIRPQGEIKRIAGTVFERTFLVTAALNTLTLLIAGISMLCALLALQVERSAFIGSLLSMGLYRIELTIGILAALLFKFLVTFILALPLGYMLAWVLIDRINILSFGWTMPLTWQVNSIFITGLVAGVVLLLTAIPVLWLVQRRPLRQWLAMARYSI